MRMSVIFLLFATLFAAPALLFAEDAADPAAASEKQLDLESHRGNAFQAHEQALEEGKYTIILFDSEACGFCKNMGKHLGSPLLAKYASRAVVSITDGETDKGARQLEEALGVVRLPTLVVLKTNNKNINVVGRIEGEVPVLEIDRTFFRSDEGSDRTMSNLKNIKDLDERGLSDQDLEHRRKHLPWSRIEVNHATSCIS